MYVRLYRSMLESTVWRGSNQVRILWITMLLLADKDGIVSASLPGLADRARLSIRECEEAIRELSSPDPYSRTPDHNGRRIVQVEGGWLIVNFKRYSGVPVPRKTQSKAGLPDREQETCTVEDLVGAWNEICSSVGLPRVRELTEARRKKIRCRLAEHPAPQFWSQVLTKVAESSFCRGDGATNWRATLDWLVANAENAIKVIEGKYDDRRWAGGKNQEARHDRELR